VIVPDSDIWTRPDLLQPVFALGKELEGRGAKATVVKLPLGPDGAKAGLDDYLSANALEAFGTLPRVSLKHALFTRMAAWWREWLRRRDASESDAPQSVLELLKKGRRSACFTRLWTWPTESCSAASLSGTG
jgi:hypothetical protein